MTYPIFRTFGWSWDLGVAGCYKKGTSKMKNERSQIGVMPEGMVRGKIVELNKEVIKAHLNTVVWSTVRP
jgi:hypothetical protein